MRAILVYACALLLFGCSEQPTQIVVSIDTDYDVPEQLAAIHVLVKKQHASDSDGKPSLDETLRLSTADAARLPLTLALTSPDGKETSVFVRLEAYGPDGKTSLVTREASARFVRDKKLLLTMNLVKRCANVRCSSSQTCGDDGRCEPIERSKLPDWPQGGPTIVGGDDRDAGDGKTPDGALDAGTARDGGAGNASMDGGVEPGDAGDNMPGRDAGKMDAGVPDAGDVDAGDTDAGDGYSHDKDAIQGIALGFGHSCVWTHGHEAYCWGDNTDAQFGAVTPSECGEVGVCVFNPRKMTEIGAVAELAAGEGFTCALSTDGSVSCFGRDNVGQLGNGAGPAGAPSKVVRTNSFGMDEPLTGITHIVAGQDWACAQESPSGGVWCWGDNILLTLGSQAGANSQRALKASAKTVADQRLFGGHGDVCVKQANGKVDCWGGNQQGALQSDSAIFDRSLSPITVLESGAKMMSGGSTHLCALVGSDVKCWGSANVDQLGITSTDPLTECGVRPCALMPVRAELDDQALSVVAGELNTCALVTGGRVFCWGTTFNGIVANALAGDPTQPKPLVVTKAQPNDQPDLPVTDVRLLPPTFYAHLCVVRGRREVLCWGEQSLGELGPNPMVSGPVADPQTVMLPAP